MSPRLPLAIVMVFAAAISVAVSEVEGQDQSKPDLKRYLDNLSAFDYSTRMNAARMLRRAPAADIVPALMDAVRGHSDQFVRYRALVLLTSFNDRGTTDLMRGLLTDRNERVREVAYRWFERHPDPGLAPALLAALDTEQAEFVRPALVRAVAALPTDPLIQRTLVAEVGRGLDFFRGAVIEALGERRAVYAVDAIAAVATSEGPLQDDALLALGRIGDRRALATLPAVTNPSPDVMPALQAAQCRLGDDCASRIEWLATTTRSPGTRPEVVRAAVAALGVVAEGNADAREALIELAGSATERLVHDVAVALSAVALRQPAETVAWLAQLSDNERNAAMDLLREGFESLEEDFAEEQFFTATRAAYWSAADASMARTVAATLIDRLEF